MEEDELTGGYVTDVVRVGSTVRRQPSDRSSFVRELLTLFEAHGWPGAPRFLGVDERKREVFSFLDGQAALTPAQQRAAGTDGSLTRVARLVREFHDLTAGSASAAGREVVCHNDLSPRNTIYAVGERGWRPVAFIDWDLAAPGERVHDVAHVCWQYLDLGPAVTDLAEAARRIRLVCDAYGPLDSGRLVDTILWWQDRCRLGIESGAARGEQAMVRLRGNGAAERIRQAHAWVAAHRSQLSAAL